MPVNRPLSAPSTSAKPKVARLFHLQTLVPNLGVVRTESSKSFVILDSPGLIEGASEGAGLGIQFLKTLAEHCRFITAYGGCAACRRF